MLSGTTTAATPWLTITEAVDEGRRAARFALVPLAAGVPVRGRLPGPDRPARSAAGRPGPADPGRPVRPGPSHLGGGGGRARSWSGPACTRSCRRPGVGAASRPKGPTGRASRSRRRSASSSPSASTSRATIRDGSTGGRAPAGASCWSGSTTRRPPGGRWCCFDTRPAVHDEASFERALEVAASVATVLHRTHQPPEVVTSGGEIMRRGGVSALDVVLDRLAVLDAEPARPPRRGDRRAAPPARSRRGRRRHRRRRPADRGRGGGVAGKTDRDAGRHPPADPPHRGPPPGRRQHGAVRRRLERRRAGQAADGISRTSSLGRARRAERVRRARRSAGSSRPPRTSGRCSARRCSPT